MNPCPRCGQTGGHAVCVGTGARPSWDEYFLAIAAVTASRSKDPSSKTGCVITSADHVQLSAGYNGFPRGADDDPAAYADRPTKLERIVHAEANAIANAARRGVALEGGTAYVDPWLPCRECAKLLIQAGVRLVVVAGPVADRIWPEDDYSGLNTLLDAGITVRATVTPGYVRTISRLLGKGDAA